MTLLHSMTPPPPICPDQSLVAFYGRVLEEARDDRNPLLERLKFLTILRTNVEELLAEDGSRLHPCARPAARRLLQNAGEYFHRSLAPTLGAEGVYCGSRPEDVRSVGRPDLRDPPLRPHVPASVASATDIFEAIRQGDVLLHHPYDSFQPVVEFIRQAAVDPKVIGISITLYRTDRDSPVGHALVEAARRGKQVHVVVELKARHDEQNNADWGRVLSLAGAHVVYGMAGLKVHAKLALVIRRERGGLRGYAHVSSGNYHQGTSAVYTDLSLLTCHTQIAADAAGVFSLLAGRGRLPMFRNAAVAPLTLRSRVHRLITREIDWSHRGEPAHLILKMNALSDPEMIRLLYRASQAGVRVDLIVRGVCCLRPGVPGISDRISVRSIVGRFLEHSRAMYFRNGGNEEVFIGSADLRSRNFDQRVEVMVPVSGAALVGRIRHQILAVYLADTSKARVLSSDGTYTRVSPAPGHVSLSSQEALQ